MAAAAIALALALAPPTASAFGPEGHALIADMAQLNLTPAARAQVGKLLAIEHLQSLDDISSWADEHRVADPSTGPFHFADIPIDDAGFDERRDCHFDKRGQHVPEATCVVAKVPEFARMLGDRSRSPQDRLLALKWVVHLLGDIHQPLHAQDSNDHGGNGVKITYFGAATNLHAVWDEGVIEHQFGWHLGPDYSFDHPAVRQQAQKLNAEIAASDRARWAQPDLVGNLPAQADRWVDESHALAPDAYRHIGLGSEAYQAYAWPVIDTQMKKASVRLAAILNGVLG